MDASRRIVVVEPDERWPAEFDAAAAVLRGALAGIAVRIDHIGSTAVPGLAAKDVIDVQVTVADLDDPRLGPAFDALGATPTDITADHVPPGDGRDRAAWRKRSFRPPAGWRPTHLHVRQAGLPNQRYALLFRDYLRHAPAAAAAYGLVKRELARLHPHDTAAYYAVKDPVCDLVVEAAERWARDVGWTP